MNDLFDSMYGARREMESIKRKKMRGSSSYKDVTRQGEYPIGLGGAGFGWGGQSAAPAVPGLKELQEAVQRANALLDPIARADSAMAQKLRGWLVPMESYLENQLGHHSY